MRSGRGKYVCLVPGIRSREMDFTGSIGQNADCAAVARTVWGRMRAVSTRGPQPTGGSSHFLRRQPQAQHGSFTRLVWHTVERAAINRGSEAQASALHSAPESNVVKAADHVDHSVPWTQRSTETGPKKPAKPVRTRNKKTATQCPLWPHSMSLSPAPHRSQICLPDVVAFAFNTTNSPIDT